MAKTKKAIPTRSSKGQSAGGQTSAGQTDASQVIADNTVVEIELPWSEVEPVYQAVLKDQARHVNQPGFRKGKVPPSVAEGAIGRGKLLEKTLEQLLPDRYNQAIQAVNHRPVTQPEFKPVQLDPGQTWRVEAHFAQSPQVKLGKYQTHVKKALKKAAKDIDQRKAEQTKKSKEAKAGRAKTKAKAEQPKTQQQPDENQIRLQHVYQALVSAIQPAIPELLLKERTRRELQHLAKSLDNLKISLDDYLSRRQQSFEQLSQELAVSALGQLQLEAILTAIIDQADIKPSKQQLDAKQAELKQHHGDNIPQAELERHARNLATREELGRHLLSL